MKTPTTKIEELLKSRISKRIEERTVEVFTSSRGKPHYSEGDALYAELILWKSKVKGNITFREFPNPKDLNENIKYGLISNEETAIYFVEESCRGNQFYFNDKYFYNDNYEEKREKIFKTLNIGDWICFCEAEGDDSVDKWYTLSYFTKLMEDKLKIIKRNTVDGIA